MIGSKDRSDELVLEANRNHSNTERGPHIERAMFRNTLSPEEALELCRTTDGEMDIVTEVSAAATQKVIDSEYAELVTCDANHVLVGIFNHYPTGVPLTNVRARKALNLALDLNKLIKKGLKGYAIPLPACTPAWSSGYPEKLGPYPHDVDAAKRLMDETGDWPDGRSLIVATPAPFKSIARMVASDIEAGLSIDIKVTVIPTGQILASSRVLTEKRITPPWDILIYGWFDLSSEASPPEGAANFAGPMAPFAQGR
jgi:ABC-type transport system substrate-binding protein